MSKITLNPVASGYNLNAINDNFGAIEDVLNDSVLFRDESVSNEMSVDLDMNGNSIYNVENIDSQQVTVAGVPLAEHIASLVVNIDPDDLTIARYTITIVEETNQVTLAESYAGSASSLIVFRNGVQQPSSYYAFDGTNITFESSLVPGETVDVVYFKSIVSALEGATISDVEGLSEALLAKQNTLVAGVNLKTVNGNSLLGSGDITISGGGGSGSVSSVDFSAPAGFSVTGNPITTSGTISLGYQSGYSLPTNVKQGQWDTAYSWGNHASAGYQQALVSGTNIKTVNGNSLLGSGNLVISGGGGSGAMVFLGTVTATNAASADITGLDTWGATYDKLVIIGSDVYFSVDNSSLLCLFSSGGTWHTNNYRYTGFQFNTTSTASDLYSGSANRIELSAALGMANTLPMHYANFTLEVYKPTVKAHVGWELMAINATNPLIVKAYAVRNQSSLEGVRFYSNGGNITGTFRVYGISKV